MMSLSDLSSMLDDCSEEVLLLCWDDEAVDVIEDEEDTDEPQRPTPALPVAPTLEVVDEIKFDCSPNMAFLLN
jgi:hypothetical protein